MRVRFIACPLAFAWAAGLLEYWGPDGKRIVFQSTYLATDEARSSKELTDAPDHDAEGTVDWKAKKIAYTSLASGDLDLWSMNVDGSGGKKRLTTITNFGCASFAPQFHALRQRACLHLESEGQGEVRIQLSSWRG
jgi:hypothetical protein